MTAVYAPVRECRRVFEENYAEQLTLYATDIAPWLILRDATTPIRSDAAAPSAASGRPAVLTTTKGSGGQSIPGSAAAARQEPL